MPMVLTGLIGQVKGFIILHLGQEFSLDLGPYIQIIQKGALTVVFINLNSEASPLK